MGARHKLNGANLNGALLIAGIAGYCTQSWIVFIVMFGSLVAIALHSGEIRRRSNHD